LIIAAPLLINIIAVFIWFIHWHGYWKSLNLKTFSVIFMALSLFLWLQVKGFEYGVIYFLISTSIIGLLYLVESKHTFKDVLRSKIHSSKTHSSIAKKSNGPLNKILPNEKSFYKRFRIKILKNSQLFIKAIINLLLLILVPFFAAASISLLLPTIFGITEANILVLSLFLFLFTWSLLLTWVTMKSQRGLALSLLSLASITTLTTIYMTNSLSASAISVSAISL
jgi:hypothetical protein